MRATLLLVLLLVGLSFLAVARAAAGGGVDGGVGGAGGEDGERFLRLWADGGGEADQEEDFFKWDEEEDDDDEAEEGHVMAWGKGTERPATCRNVVNVDTFGAAGDGDADDTEVSSPSPLQPLITLAWVGVVKLGAR